MDASKYSIFLLILTLIGCQEREGRYAKMKRELLESIAAKGPISEEQWNEMGAVAQAVQLSKEAPVISPEEAEAAIGESSELIADIFRRKAVDELIPFIHPTKGLFIEHPQGYSLTNGHVFTRATIVDEYRANIKADFGISVQAPDRNIYYNIKEFIDDIHFHDFSKHTSHGFNSFDPFVTQQNGPITILQVHPEWIIEEYFFEKGHDGDSMWVANWLVYEKYEGKWYLVGLKIQWPEI